MQILCFFIFLTQHLLEYPLFFLGNCISKRRYQDPVKCAKYCITCQCHTSNIKHYTRILSASLNRFPEPSKILNLDLPEKNKNGFFVGPTIIRDVTPCNPLFTTEVFGPLVATIKVADLDDALSIINASEYGNGACIFTQNMHYAEVFSREAEVGMVGVNVGICAPHPYVPFGGIKGSLLGTDKVQGKGGLDFFTQNKITTVRTYDPKGKKGQDAPKSASVRSCVAS